jgi:hypothetical protein
MRFWVRELAGWLLVLLGLFVFYVCFAVLVLTEGPWLFEAIFLTVIGVVIFRSGIHLLKVAVAARVCLQAQARLREEEARGRPRTEGRKAGAARSRPASAGKVPGRESV